MKTKVIPSLAIDIMQQSWYYTGGVTKSLMEEKKQVAIYITKSIHTKVKVDAAENGTSVSAIVEKELRDRYVSSS